MRSAHEFIRESEDNNPRSFITDIKLDVRQQELEIAIRFNRLRHIFHREFIRGGRGEVADNLLIGPGIGHKIQRPENRSKSSLAAILSLVCAVIGSAFS
ncbi:MAG: hypothetical protein WBF58_11890 [Xanthobacteraceae bacterium]